MRFITIIINVSSTFFLFFQDHPQFYFLFQRIFKRIRQIPYKIYIFFLSDLKKHLRNILIERILYNFISEKYDILRYTCKYRLIDIY